MNITNFALLIAKQLQGVERLVCIITNK